MLKVDKGAAPQLGKIPCLAIFNLNGYSASNNNAVPLLCFTVTTSQPGEEARVQQLHRFPSSLTAAHGRPPTASASLRHCAEAPHDTGRSRHRKGVEDRGGQRARRRGPGCADTPSRFPLFGCRPPAAARPGLLLPSRCRSAPPAGGAQGGARRGRGGGAEALPVGGSGAAPPWRWTRGGWRG